MQKCPKCLAEQNNINSSACFYCGADMSESMKEQDNNCSSTKNDDYIPEQNISLPDSDDLGVETTADIMESEAHQLNDSSPTDQIKNFQEDSLPSKNSENDNSQENKLSNGDIKKLSESEIKEIEKNLYKSNNFIDNQEKSDLIKKINSLNYSAKTNQPFSNTPINPHTNNEKRNETPKTKVVSKTKIDTDRPTPKKANSQGLAYFYNSYIQIQGSQKLHNDDLMKIDNRDYVLKQKNFNKNIALYSVGALLVLIVSVLGSFLAGNSNFGNGQVFGVVLDDNNSPFIEGATIIFTELGEKSSSDSQGLFTFSNIPAGSHKIEYFIDDKVIGVDYITIVDNSNSYITLRPNIEEIAQTIDPVKKLALAVAEKESAQKAAAVKTKAKSTVAKKQKTKKVIQKKTVSKKATSKRPASGYGKLVLRANVDGAKFKVDGNVLGAGNLTYSKIKSGKHSYTVSMDGYKTVSGSFNLKKGETKKISPVLSALTQAKKEKTYKKSDYYYSAQNAFKQGDYQTAIADYQKVIEESPNNVKAYNGLAESYSQLKKWDLAYDNYVRAAEIYRFKRKNNDAITNYNKAIDINNKSLNAYLGRGAIYLAAGEYRAAFGDFDKVVKIDKRNFDGYYGLGEASFKLLRYGKAIKYFKDARSLDKNNPLVHQYLTLSYMYDHDRKNSKKSFEKFNQYASEKEKSKFRESSQYAAVTKYIDSE